MGKALLAVVVCSLCFCPPSFASGNNPFISNEPKASEKVSPVPGYSSKMITKLTLWQKRLNSEITRLTKELKRDHSKKPLVPLILMAFLYGVLHAAGPGHGKAIAFSYFLSGRSHIKKGIILGNVISFLHAFSAVFSGYTYL